jgi:hypothetical protein
LTSCACGNRAGAAAVPCGPAVRGADFGCCAIRRCPAKTELLDDELIAGFANSDQMRSKRTKLRFTKSSITRGAGASKRQPKTFKETFDVLNANLDVSRSSLGKW